MSTNLHALSRFLRRASSLAVFLGMLAAVNATVARSQEATSDRADLAALSADAAVLISTEFGKHWRGSELETLQQVSKSHPSVITSELAILEPAFGITPEQIERVTVSFAPAQGPLVFVTFTKPELARPFLQKLTKEVAEKRVGDKAILVSEDASLAGGLIDERTVVAGPPTLVEKQFGAAPAAMPGPQDQSFRTVAKSAPLLIAQVRPADFQAGLKPVAANTPFAPLVDAVCWRVTFDARKDLVVTLRAEFPDAASAKNATEALKQLLTVLESYFKMAEEKMLPMLDAQIQQYPKSSIAKPHLADALAAARKALQISVVEVRDNATEAVVNIRTERPVTTAIMLLTLLPRAKKPTP